jgi:phosphoribosylaminoimidazolecarboxamide formyltransferase/IMP cyclohydrolase
MTIRRALLSVYDKTGLADFAWAVRPRRRAPSRRRDGEGARRRRIPVTAAQLTGFGDLLDHRVVTLHPPSTASFAP